MRQKVVFICLFYSFYVYTLVKARAYCLCATHVISGKLIIILTLHCLIQQVRCRGDKNDRKSLYYKWP